MSGQPDERLVGERLMRLFEVHKAGAGLCVNCGPIQESVYVPI